MNLHQMLLSEALRNGSGSLMAQAYRTDDTDASTEEKIPGITDVNNTEEEADKHESA